MTQAQDILALGQVAQPAQLTTRIIREEIMARLQDGGETYLVATEKCPRVVTLPPWPGRSASRRETAMPLIHEPVASHKRLEKGHLLGFLYVIEGEAELLLNRRLVTCHTGNFVFLPYNWSDRGTTRHWKRLETSTAHCDFLWLFIGPQDLASHASWLRGNKHVGSRHLFITDSRIFLLAEQLYEEIATGNVSPSARSILWLIYDRFLCKLKDGQYTTNRMLLQEVAGKGDELFENIGYRAQKYVDANLMQRLTLEGVARAIYTSRARLAREFQEHTGETFGAYLLRRRIEQAQQLLLTTPGKVKDIAWRSGFSDPDYFCAVFRRSVGKTPTEFRNARRLSGF